MADNEQGQKPDVNPDQAQAPEPQKEAPEQVQAEGQQEGAPKMEMKMPDIMKKAEGQPAVTTTEKLWGLLSYVPLLAVLALVIHPRSDYIKLHGRQGLLLFLIFFFSIFIYIVPLIGYIIGGVIHLAVIIIGLFSMFQAFIGNWWKIPVLGDVAGMIPVEIFTKVTREAVMGAKSDELAEKDQKVMEKERAQEEPPAEETAQAPEVQEEQAVEEAAAPEAAPPVEEAPAPPAEPEKVPEAEAEAEEPAESAPPTETPPEQAAPPEPPTTPEQKPTDQPPPQNPQ